MEEIKSLMSHGSFIYDVSRYPLLPMHPHAPPMSPLTCVPCLTLHLAWNPISPHAPVT